MAIAAQIEKVQGQALDSITEGQQRALELNERVADVLKHRVPSLKFPFTGVLPTPTEGVKLYFDFAGKLLASNRAFAEKLVDAWEVKPAKAAGSAAASAPAATAAPRARKAAAKPRARKAVA